MPVHPAPPPLRRSNVSPGAGRVPDGDRWAAFDALPVRLRQALRDALHPFSAVTMLAEVLRHRRAGMGEAEAVAAILRRLGETEARDMEAFARRTWARPSPHLLAGVSVMRSGEAPLPCGEAKSGLGR